MSVDDQASLPLGSKETAEYAFDLQVGLEGADVPEFDAGRLIGNAAILAVNLRGLGEVEYASLRLCKHLEASNRSRQFIFAVAAYVTAAARLPNEFASELEADVNSLLDHQKTLI